MMKARFRAACLMGLALLTAACGPGVGGTGTTEPVDLSAFAASAASVCAATFAGQLSCTPGQNSVTSADGQPVGTQPVRFVDRQLGANLLVVFADNGVQLTARCRQIDFSGTWGTLKGSDPRYYGTQLVAGQLSRSLATLTVQPSTGGALSAVLRDADGQIMLGPLDLVPAPVPMPEAPACSPLVASPEPSPQPVGEPLSCDASQPGSPSVPFAPLDANLYGDWPARTYVVRTADEWAVAWASHDPLQVPVPARPAIDFPKCMVVGLSLGWGADGCHGVNVTRVDEAGDAVRVTYHTSTQPPPGAACTQSLVPMLALVRIRQTPKPVLFVPGG